MSFANLFTDARAALVFLAMISILVAAHEYGHYLFARIFRMGVEDFSIGMGKKIKVWKRKTYLIAVPKDYVHEPELVSRGAAFEGGDRPVESVLIQTPEGTALQETTEFTLRVLPVGGFVRIKGMIPLDDGSEVRIPGGFYSKPPWQRLLVLVAGPAASVLSGLVVLVALFMISGVTKLINEPVLGDVGPGSIAEQAHLERGDRITEVNGRPVSTFNDLVVAINSNAGKILKLNYRRGSSDFVTTVTPNATEGPTFTAQPGSRYLDLSMAISTHGVIGVYPERKIVPSGFLMAAGEAVHYPIDAVQSMFEMVKHPSVAKHEAGGVITMVRATSDAAEAGLGATVGLACLLSISVGIFNLLPFPPLDGGQMAIAFAEMFRGGRRLSIQVQQAVTSAGMILVVVLFFAVLFIDIERVVGGGPASPSAAHAVSQSQKK